jgi:hypothetical protein
MNNNITTPEQQTDLEKALQKIADLEKQLATKPTTTAAKTTFKVYECYPYESLDDEKYRPFGDGDTAHTEVPRDLEVKWVLTEKGFIEYHRGKMNTKQARNLIQDHAIHHPTAKLKISVTDPIFATGVIDKDRCLGLYYRLIIGKELHKEKAVFFANKLTDRRKKAAVEPPTPPSDAPTAD